MFNAEEWCKKGIVGRGVLIDFVEYAIAHGIDYDPTSRYAISLPQIKEIARAANVEFRQGDILFVRTGTS